MKRLHSSNGSPSLLQYTKYLSVEPTFALMRHVLRGTVLAEVGGETMMTLRTTYHELFLYLLPWEELRVRVLYSSASWPDTRSDVCVVSLLTLC